MHFDFCLDINLKGYRMLIRDITYTDYSDEPKEITETFHFNISKVEIIDMEVQYKEGLSAFLDGIIKAEDRKEIFNKFKDIVLIAYGERSEDRKQFNKSPEIRDRFANSAAYQQLCFELMSSERSLAEFLLGALPKDIVNSEEGKKLLTPVVAAVPPLEESPTPPNN